MSLPRSVESSGRAGVVFGGSDVVVVGGTVVSSTKVVVSVIIGIGSVVASIK